MPTQTSRTNSTPSSRTAAPPVVRDVLATPGRPLDRESRAFFEPRFGHDFSRVRVHADARAVDSARAVEASAYTVGQHIVMGTTDAGRQQRLLAHELGHTLQQPPYEQHRHAELHVDDAHERQAALAEQRVLGGDVAPQPLSFARAANVHVARFKGPMPPPVRPMPRGPVQTVPGTARGGGYTPSGAPLMAPDPYDTSFQAMLDRAAIRNYAERQKIAAERPIVTLDRGGAAPGFITERGTRRVSWMGGPGGAGEVDARIRRFHILDAIEHAVSRVTTEDQLAGVIQRYIPDRAFLILGVGTGRELTLAFTPGVLLSALDEPVFPTAFDPQGQKRLEVLQAAVEARAKTVPALAQSALAPRGRRKGSCRIEPIEPMGDDPLSTVYCHAVTGSPYSYRITILTPDGKATKRWAEIDALRGNTWFECKCGYEALLSGAARGERVANAVLDRLDHQVLNHVDIARTCGLDYRYIVSNDSVATRLRQRWFGNVTIDVREFDPCD